MATIEIKDVIQGKGFVVFKDGLPRVVVHKCMGDNEAWSFRVAGAKFPMSPGHRFLASHGRKYDEMTYVEGGEKMLRMLAVEACKRRHKVIDPIYVPGVKESA